MGNVKIFLSSTFLDLSDTRKEISTWLSGVFGADLIIMETFGSDAAPPNLHSVRRVNECDIFIGIYAHRYGTIDPASGKSITELELDEAKHALSTGTVSDILLYLIEENSSWGQQHKEISQVAQVGLKRIKDKANQHTCSFFKSADDLLFFIVRDVHRRISDRFPSAPVRLRLSSLPEAKTIKEPLGMDFLTSVDRNYLFGRHRDTAELMDCLADVPIVLLLGDSGVGKTSLIHAGLIPVSADLKMRPIYTRPLGLPCMDIAQKIQTTVFEGPPTYRGSLVPLLAETSAALKGTRALLIIDQFEDVLAAQDANEVVRLVTGLRSIHELADPSLRVLISYRADLEGRLGQYWQQISGSPKGLTRYYLSGINEDQAWQGIKKVAADLSVSFALRDVEEKRIARDLLVSSSAAGFSGVYPPYLQMLIEHVWSSTQKAQKPYRIENYQEAGGMEGVIGGYLNRLLQYAQDSEGHIRAVLVSLVRSYGVKAQRTLSEVASDTGLQDDVCEGALEKLIDLRLVRHLDPYYEVSHDYIAKKIIADLADSEEREFKCFRELLTSKAGAYQTTQSLLNHHELLMLYKHREKVIATEQEGRLLLASWVNGIGPALYWLMNIGKLKLIEWLRAEESKEDLAEEQKISIILLRRKLGEVPLSERDYDAFRYYKLSAELSHLISENPLSMPRELMLYGLRHRRGEVRQACRNAISAQIKNGTLDWIQRVRGSSGSGCREAYQYLIFEAGIPTVDSKDKTDTALTEFWLLRRIASSRSLREVNNAFRALKKRNPPRHMFLFAKALKYVREEKVTDLLSLAARVSAGVAEQLLSGIRGTLSAAYFDALASAYEKHNLRDFKGQQSFGYTRSRIYRISSAIATAIQRSMSQEHLPRLRATLRSISLTPSSRGIIYALLYHGDVRDIKLILDRISDTKVNVDIWNHTELGMIAAKQMATQKGGIPKFLIGIVGRKEFWEYIRSEDRPRHPKSDLLPLREVGNKGLYVRLAAYSAIGAAKLKNRKILLDLAQHYFRLVARAAGIRLIRLNGESALRQLISLLESSFEKGTAESLADAIRYAEMDYFGLRISR
jgi:hypothetical protein